MSKRKDSYFSKRKDSYRWHTQRPLNCLLFILPFMVFYHGGSFMAGGESVLRAPSDMGRLLNYFGAIGPASAYLPAMMIVVVLLIQHFAHRDKWEIQPPVLAGMCGESIIWMIPLIALSHLSGKLAARIGLEAVSGQSGPILNQFLIAAGAGIYEEFIFRLVLISLFLLLFVDIFALRKDIITVAAIVIAAVLFGLYHFNVGQLTNLRDFPWINFIFYATAGVYLGAVFVFRGFGIAVGAHILYNFYVVMLS